MISVVTGLAALNLLNFFTFRFDKRAAMAGEWRVPESRLLGLALIGGSPAAWIACHLLRHKTKKQPFRAFLTAVMPIQGAFFLLWLSQSFQ